MASDVFSVILAPVIAAASALIGVAIGGLITSHNQKVERRQRFVRDQLTEFYAPLLGLRERVHAYGKIRVKVNNAVKCVVVTPHEGCHSARNRSDSGD